MGHTAACACGSVFRFEACDLATGTVLDVIHPVSANWQTELNDSGQGVITLATKDVSVRNIWPHLTSIYITRISGGDASLENPVVEFAGMVEEFDSPARGTTQVGLKGITEYLNYRHFDNGFTDTSNNTALPTKLVNEGIQPNGIPLSAQDMGTSRPGARTRTYEEWEYKNVGEAVSQFTQIIEGPDWELVHTKVDGAWSSVMRFRDFVGNDTGQVIKSKVDAADFGLTVDATGHATHVHALGEGEEVDMLVVAADDEDGPYVRFDATPSWKTVSRIETLTEHAEGYIEDRREPFALPSVTLAGLDPDPELIQLGDTISIDTNYGAVTYKGKARVIERAWSLSRQGITRTFGLTPISRASEAVLSQIPSNEDCEDC